VGEGGKSLLYGQLAIKWLDENLDNRIGRLLQKRYCLDACNHHHSWWRVWISENSEVWTCERQREYLGDSTRVDKIIIPEAGKRAQEDLRDIVVKEHRIVDVLPPQSAEIL